MRKAKLKKYYPFIVGRVELNPCAYVVDNATVDYATDKLLDVVVARPSKIKKFKVHGYFNLFDDHDIDKAVSRLNFTGMQIGVDVSYPFRANLYEIAKAGEVRMIGRKYNQILQEARQTEAWVSYYQEACYWFDKKAAVVCKEHNDEAIQRVKRFNR